MNITLNGKQKNIESQLSLINLIKEVGLKKEHIVIEANRKILSKDDIDTFVLKENDEIEFISFFGGGGRSGK